MVTAQTGIAFPVDLYAPQQVLAMPQLSALPVSLNNGFVATTQALYVQDQVDLAPRWKALAGLRFFTTASLFRIEQRNQLTLDPTDPAGLRQLQVGKQRNQGVELELQGRLWQGGRVSAAYTYNDARIVASNDIPSGNRAEMTARHRASLWLDQQLAASWSAGLGVLLNSDQFALSDNTVRLPGYGRVDAALTYRQPAYDVRFKINNLGDARFFESAINNVQIQPGAPRSASVTVSARF